MERAKNMSKSMVSYLRKAREHKEFIAKEVDEFERGKRHLANIMGIHPNEMTQDVIDKAITYLFPSGLFDKKARPLMKHPDILFSSQKEAQFDIKGRPYHYLFYTSKPNYNEYLITIGKTARDLYKYEDLQLANGILDAPATSYHSMFGKNWKTHDQVCNLLIEPIIREEYDYLILSLERLRALPYSNQANSLLNEFLRDMPYQAMDLGLPEIKKDKETGQIYTEIDNWKRAHRMKIKVVLNGTGKFDLDGEDILAFPEPHYRAAIFAPIQLSGMVDRVDIHAKLVSCPQKKGYSAIAGCIRHAVASSIAAFVSPEMRERMRLAGYLTVDTRVKERKKFGQEGARRKYTWKKR